MRNDRPLDVAIIGGGIASVVHLHYARRAGLDAMVLEAQEAWAPVAPAAGLAGHPDRHGRLGAGRHPAGRPAAATDLPNIEAWAAHPFAQKMSHFAHPMTEITYKSMINP